MSKCYICGNESNVEITIKGYNHTETVCGVCLVDKDLIKVPEIAELIRQAEGLPKGKACFDCKYLCKSNDKFYCNYHNNLELDKMEVSKNYCDNFERLRK